MTYATHDETGHVRVHQPRQARVPRGLARVAAGPARGRSRSRQIVGPAKSESGRAVRSTGAVQTAGRGLGGDAVGRARARSSVLVRPVLSPMPAGTTLRVELLAERRGSELRADVTAEAETVHVRVWQDGVEALERHFRAPRRTEVDLLAAAIEAGGHDPSGWMPSAPRPPWPGPAGRAGVTSAPGRASDRRRRCGGRAGPRRRRDRPGPGRRHRRAWRRPLGDDRRLGPGRDLPRAPAARSVAISSIGAPSTSGGATTGSSRAITRCATSRPLDEILLDEHDGVPIPLEHLHPFRRPRPSASGHDAASCAAALAEELALVGPSSPGGWPRVRPRLPRDRRGRPHPVGLSRFGGVRFGRLGDGHPGAYPHRAARRAGHDAPGDRDRRPRRAGRGQWARRRRTILADVLGPVREPRRWPAQVARHERATWILDDEAAARLPR